MKRTPGFESQENPLKLAVISVSKNLTHCAKAIQYGKFVLVEKRAIVKATTLSLVVENTNEYTFTKFITQTRPCELFLKISDLTLSSATVDII